MDAHFTINALSEGQEASPALALHGPSFVRTATTQ